MGFGRQKYGELVTYPQKYSDEQNETYEKYKGVCNMLRIANERNYPIYVSSSRSVKDYNSIITTILNNVQESSKLHI